MKKELPVIVGLLIVLAIGFYVYSINKQISDVNEVCSLFPKGAKIGDLKEVEKRYSVRLRGPYEAKERPNSQFAIFCAHLTMCDAACMVEFKNGIVTGSKEWKL